ncbi:hypothetical protein BP5796_06638 [Coleophoma crateriformis]|uniref:Uncharacterized protein n=1 Tax=Coleophoma crateriformis TaxID=565419 RepID=A0A3D8RP23_9HELO|nr:hypothetical protein BP5796_06638 [Coleophoma crateriformis]
MALELHVWGPAFGLPSVDAHCLAAIAYLQHAVPRGKWRLIASSNPALSPTNELPALRHGKDWIGGFRNIFHYLAQCSAGEWVLDAGLSEQAAADCIAFSSFVESHGQPLLDLSLYVSTQNYTAITRPVYNTIQSFPLPYLTPPTIRAAAKERTAYLGLSSLDIDSDDSVPKDDKSIIPESLRKPRATVSNVLASTPETAARIRLDALATNFFEPLQLLRGKKRFFVSNDQFTSLDCLALGFLSLMLLPELLQPWLAKTMTSKFPDLCAFVEKNKSACFGEVELQDAFANEAAEKRTNERDLLPWQAPARGSPLTVGNAFFTSMADNIPIIGQLRRNDRMRQFSNKSADETTAWRRLTMVGSIVGAVGLFIGFMFHQGFITLPPTHEEEEKRRGLDDFGEAGAALAALASHMDSEANFQRMQEQRMRDPIVEVDVEVDPLKA